MSNFGLDPFVASQTSFIKSSTLSGDMWLTWLSSLLAVPRSAGSAVSDTGADWEPRGAALEAI